MESPDKSKSALLITCRLQGDFHRKAIIIGDIAFDQIVEWGRIGDTEIAEPNAGLILNPVDLVGKAKPSGL